MPEEIPLFPLGTVLFPGVVLPLHIFEPRYRTLVRDLLAYPPGQAREFGVVAIRQGWEVGASAATALHEVGCVAELRQVVPHADGRFDIVSVGRERFRLVEVDPTARPYPRGSVERLDDEAASGTAEEVATLTANVQELFGYCRTLLRNVQQNRGNTQAGEDDPPSHTASEPSPPAEPVRSAASGRAPDPLPALRLPADPAMLSYLVGSVAPLTLDDRQRLLAIDDVVGRLRHLLRLLKREATMLSRLRAAPVPLAHLRVPSSQN